MAAAYSRFVIGTTNADIRYVAGFRLTGLVNRRINLIIKQAKNWFEILDPLGVVHLLTGPCKTLTKKPRHGQVDLWAGKWISNSSATP
jgi:hypothetical protein